MGFLDVFSKRERITELAYDDIPLKHIDQYQNIFNKVIISINVDNYDNWAKDRPVDQTKLDSDDELMAKIIFREMKDTSLNPATLQVMIHQYFFADPIRRESDKTQWVKKVMYRNPIDYFPSAHAIIDILGME